MLASADAIDAERAGAVAAERRSAWPAMRRELEDLGCGVSRVPDDTDAWRIVGHGVNIEIDFATGETNEHGLFYEPDPFGKLVAYVARELENRRQHDATEARKQALRQTHDWNNKLKGWVPKDGKGPIIKGGGQAPKA